MHITLSVPVPELAPAPARPRPHVDPIGIVVYPRERSSRGERMANKKELKVLVFGAGVLGSL
ncbi:MAG: hypothetical protein EA403_03175, partial [Spirochaetaceae bacterium]